MYTDDLLPLFQTEFSLRPMRHINSRQLRINGDMDSMPPVKSDVNSWRTFEHNNNKTVINEE